MAARAEIALGQKLPLDEDARAGLYELADGDGRALLGLVEEVFAATKPGEILDKAGLTASGAAAGRRSTTRSRTATTI